MRVIGVILFLLGSVATGYATWGAYARSRPADVVLGVLAPISLLLAVSGLVLVFVPGFWS